MSAAWIAAGSAGLMVPALRHALGWLAMGVAVVAARPHRRPTRPERLALAAAVVVAVGMTVPAATGYNVLAVAVLLAMLARAAEGVDRRAMTVATFAVLVLAVYRLACDAIPAVWLAADAAAAATGRLAQWVLGKPLWVGATVAGLDFLVLMAALVVGWLVYTAPPRTARAICALMAVLVGHALYLVVLAWSSDLHAMLPVAPLPPQGDFYTPPPWHWGEAARSLLPWNVPALAVAIQVVIAAVVFRWASWLPASDQAPQPARKSVEGKAGETREDEAAAASPGETPIWCTALALALAAAIPLLTTCCAGTADLAGKKIVAYEHGHLDWVKPTHDRYGQASVGMYGMLPELIDSLGGKFARSADLTDQDLSDADLLLVIHPLTAWPEERSSRVWEFVRRGGSLLVVAGPRVQKDETPTCVNRLLEQTGVQVRFDIAMSATGYWQHACQSLAHPATTGLADDRCGFGLAIGPSLHVRWPARPILVGRWAWSDPGSDALLTGHYRYDAGERLGDLVLAAEQQVGQGRVLVLADHTSLANEALPQSYRFAGRLLGYLAGAASTPQATWRQVLGLLACLALVVFVGWRFDPGQLAAVAAVLAISLAFSRTSSDAAWQVLPRSPASGTKIAYIDASHAEAFVDSRWHPDGIAGLSLTLMRNGYLPLLLPELTRQRLERGSMLISIGPSRSFSSDQEQAIGEFLEKGGIFICMAGADRAQAVNPLLGRFGLHVPVSPIPAREQGPEPIPMSCVRGPYVPDEQSKAQVSFHAVWPIECPLEDVLIQGPDNKPIAAVRNVGRGKIVLIGDTEFALNKNLETTEGAQVFWPAKNVNFWRWLLARLTDQPPWIPPDPKPEEKPAEDTDAPDAMSPDATSPDATQEEARS